MNLYFLESEPHVINHKECGVCGRQDIPETILEAHVQQCADEYLENGKR